MFKCTKCNNESKKEHIVCVKCGSVGMYVSFEPERKKYVLRKTPIVKKTKFESDQELKEWFEARRKEMTGYCSCGCGRKSSKDDDRFYKASLAHILAKKNFESVRTHPDNWIELSFWEGHHANMDNRSSELWVKMACWPEIKRKTAILKPLIPQNELKFLPLVLKNIWGEL